MLKLSKQKAGFVTLPDMEMEMEIEVEMGARGSGEVNHSYASQSF